VPKKCRQGRVYTTEEKEIWVGKEKVLPTFGEFTGSRNTRVGGLKKGGHSRRERGGRMEIGEEKASAD